MKNKASEIVFILDRSGSMQGLEKDTIGGYNSMLDEQKEKSGDANVTTVLFDDRYELLCNRRDIKKVLHISDREYYARGTTALLDAIGKTIYRLDNELCAEEKEGETSSVMFVITTDGLENASKEYGRERIRCMIERKKKDGWEFLFLGANIDAIKCASHFGIDEDRAVNFHADEQGVKLNFQAMCQTITQFREGDAVPQSWKRSIEEDFKKRGE